MFMKPFTKRFFSSTVSPTIIVSPLIVSMFIVGGVYTSMLISEIRRESLYMKYYHEEIMEQLRRIERK